MFFIINLFFKKKKSVIFQQKTVENYTKKTAIFSSIPTQQNPFVFTAFKGENRRFIRMIHRILFATIGTIFFIRPTVFFARFKATKHHLHSVANTSRAVPVEPSLSAAHAHVPSDHANGAQRSQSQAQHQAHRLPRRHKAARVVQRALAHVPRVDVPAKHHHCERNERVCVRAACVRWCGRCARRRDGACDSRKSGVQWSKSEFSTIGLVW